MTMKTIEQLESKLDAKIPRSAVKEREGAAGRWFSYLSTDYVIDRNNRVFGNLNWSSETIQNKVVFEGAIPDSRGNPKHCVSYIAIVKIEVRHVGSASVTSHFGTGYGDGQDSINIGKAHELAAKEAESDALKRACKNLGQSMGLALYDKDQKNVSDFDDERLAELKNLFLAAKDDEQLFEAWEQYSYFLKDNRLDAATDAEMVSLKDQRKAAIVRGK